MFACTLFSFIRIIERFHSRDQHLCKLLEQKKAFTGFVSNTKISLFRNTSIIGRHDVM